MWIEMISAYIILVQKSEEKGLHGICRCKWEDNTKMYLGEIESDNVDSIHLS
jgi:hypothetical protein